VVEIIMLNPQNGKLVKVNRIFDNLKSEKEIEYEKEGFVAVASAEKFRYDKKGFLVSYADFGAWRRYKVVYCKHHKIYELYYAYLSVFNDEDDKYTEFALKVAEVVKDCRFLKKEKELFRFFLPFIPCGKKDLDKHYNFQIKIIKKLNKLSKTILYFYLNFVEFKEMVENYFKNNGFDKYNDAENLKKILDMYLKEFVDSYDCVFGFDYVITIFYELRALFGNDEIFKKHLKRVKRKVLRNVDKIIENCFYVSEEYLVKMIYELTNCKKVLKYLL